MIGLTPAYEAKPIQNFGVIENSLDAGGCLRLTTNSLRNLPIACGSDSGLMIRSRPARGKSCRASRLSRGRGVAAL